MSTPDPTPHRRAARTSRATRETSIEVSVDLDGTGATEVATGLPFFDHMLSQLGKHGGVDLVVAATGDLDVDAHHTVEDVGIALGGVFAEALGDKAGVRRFASVSLPLDEALVDVALDLSGRPYLAYGIDFAPDTPGLGYATLRPAAGRGVLAGLRHGRRRHPARPPRHRTQHPPHPRGLLQGGGPGVAGRGTDRGRGHPVHQGRRCEPPPRLRDRRPRLRHRQPALGREGPPAGRGRRPAGRRPRCRRRRGRRRAARRGRLRAVRRGPRARPVWVRPPPTPSPAGVPFLGICVGFQLLYEGLGGGSVGRRPRRPGRHRPPAAGGRQASPDAVEHAPRRPLGAAGRRARSRPGSTSSTPTRPERTADTTSTCDYGGDVVATAERGPGVGHPVPPREVRGRSASASWPTSWPRSAASRPDGPLPGHRHPRRGSGAPDPGRLRPPERVRRPGGARRAVRRRPVPRGCTSSTSTGPARADPVNRAVVTAIADAVGRPCRDGGRRAHRGRHRRTARTPDWPG